MNNSCIQCGKDLGGNYPECHLVENDLPDLLQIEDGTAKTMLTTAIQSVHKMRCEFMNWLITMGFAKTDPKDPMLYVVPKDIEMRPSEMADVENELIEFAKTGFGGLATAIEEYVTRSFKFYTGQRDFMLANGKKF